MWHINHESLSSVFSSKREEGFSLQSKEEGREREREMKHLASQWNIIPALKNGEILSL